MEPVPRYRIERAAKGYRVVGPDLLIWEPTLGEAAERREELEMPGWRHPLAPRAFTSPRAAFRSVVYGPVLSRRLGRSLGINLSPPGRRVCNFECVYCAYAETPAPGARSAWPTPDQVGRALGAALPGVGALDSITISGHGEPTLHPRFPAVVGRVLEEARRARPHVPVRILSNGSQAVRLEVRRALDRLDERIVKLDADPLRACRPSQSTPLGALLLGLALLRDVTLQSCFFEGAESNVTEPALAEWVSLVSEIDPLAVQIYTLDRQPARADIRPVAAARLEEIACHLRAATGIEARVYA